MSTHYYRVIFNKQRGCMMAVSEVASSTGKSKSGKSRKSGKSPSKRCNHCVLSVSSTSKVNLGDFYPLKMAAAQSTRAQAATNSIVSYLPGINLTGDVIMLEEREVDVPNSNTKQKVLVPIVYLASIKPGDLQASGALIAAANINLANIQGFANAGTIQSTGDLTIAMALNATLNNRGGNLKAGQLLTLSTLNSDIDLTRAEQFRLPPH